MRFYLLILFSIMIYVELFAQNSKDTPDITFESLKLNSAPSFVILGVEPENIQRPTSPQKFIAGIQNAVVDGKLQPNWAMELSPYYWKNPEGDNSKVFSGRDFASHESFFRNLYKSLSISLSTSATDSISFGQLKKGTGLGFGVRFLLIDGKINRDIIRWSEFYHIRNYLLNSLDAKLRLTRSKDAFYDTLTQAVQIVMNNYEQSINQDDSATPQYLFQEKSKYIKLMKSEMQRIRNDLIAMKSLSMDSIESYLEKELEFLTAKEDDLLKKININKNPLAKEGFMLELAFGEAILFQENKFNQATHARGALWLTPSYRINLRKSEEIKQNLSMLDIMGVLRYSFNNQRDSVDISDYFDIGLKAQYTLNKFSMSLEGVYRYATEKPAEVEQHYSYRLVGSANYKINSIVTLNLNFGTNFNGNTTTFTEPKEIFVVGGLNIGIFKGTEDIKF